MPNDELHGHLVLQTIARLGRPITRQQLRELLEPQTGPDPRFRTCSAEGLNFDGLIAFLIARGKILETPEGLVFEPAAHICEDE